MHRILKSTLHKQCSCPEGKQCSRCIKIKTLKSSNYRTRSPNEISSKRQNKLCQWYTRRKALNDLKALHRKERQDENERRLDLERKQREQEVLEYLKRCTSEVLPSVNPEKKVHNRRRSESSPPHPKSRQSRWKSRHKLPDDAPTKRQNLHQWYKRRRTLKDHKMYNNQEHKVKEKNRTEQARLEREYEVYDLMRQRSESLPSTKVKKKVHVKRRSTSAKPRSASRYVTVKRYNNNDSLRQRCANCFYRMCCRCYCYLTCIFLVVFFVICII